MSYIIRFSKYSRINWPALGIITGIYILWALCYPPFVFGPVIFVALAPIFLVTAKLSKGGAFFYNFIGGLFYNGIMYYWIYNVMEVGPPFIIMLGLSLLTTG